MCPIDCRILSRDLSLPYWKYDPDSNVYITGAERHPLFNFVCPVLVNFKI